MHAEGGDGGAGPVEGLLVVRLLERGVVAEGFEDGWGEALWFEVRGGRRVGEEGRDRRGGEEGGGLDAEVGFEGCDFGFERFDLGVEW